MKHESLVIGLDLCLGVPPAPIAALPRSVGLICRTSRKPAPNWACTAVQVIAPAYAAHPSAFYRFAKAVIQTVSVLPQRRERHTPAPGDVYATGRSCRPFRAAGQQRIGRLVKCGADQLVAAAAEAALHVGFAGSVAPHDRRRCAPASRDFRKQSGWSIVARNANTVSGTPPGTVMSRRHVSSARTSSSAWSDSRIPGPSPRRRPATNQPGWPAPGRQRPLAAANLSTGCQANVTTLYASFLGAAFAAFSLSLLAYSSPL